MARPRMHSEEEAKEQKRIYNREYNKKNKEKVSLRVKEYRLLNKERVLGREALYRKNNREALRERQSKWYHKDSVNLIQTNPKKLMLRKSRNSAKQRKIEFSITEEDFEIPKYCPILGIKLEFHKGDREDNSPSMDRINNHLGYIPGNVQVISVKANRFKSDMSNDEIRKLYNFVFKT